MVGYTTIGTNDLPKAIEFYTTLLGEFGAKELINLGRLVMFGKDMKNGMLAVCTPFDGNAAVVGNGQMVALNMESKENVDKIYNSALGLGATDDGPLGERMPGFYAGYFRDLDGNKFCVFCMGAA